MQLSKTERLFLANQYRILEAVDPKNGEYYATSREAVESGYESAISNIFDHIYDGLAANECSLVVMAMAVYDAIQRSYKSLRDKNGIDEWRTQFPGFDGNNETAYMAYAEFIVEHEARFTYLVTADDGFNSHFPSVERYREMIDLWKGEMDQSYELSRDQLLRLLGIN